MRKGVGRIKKPATRAGFQSMVGVGRVELPTPAMSTQCSTTELYAHSSVCGCLAAAEAPFNLRFPDVQAIRKSDLDRDLLPTFKNAVDF